MVLNNSSNSLLQNRDFVRYFCAAFMAMLAIQIEAVAVAWQIYAIARTPLALGYVGLAQFVPMATLFFVAGDVVDYHNRRRILTITYAAQALATILLLTLTCL